MSEPPNLVPPPVAARCRSSRAVPFAFGRRCFLLLLVGLVWIGPAWSDPRFLYAMAFWDAAVAALWVVDLRRLPRPEQLEVRRMWDAPLELSVEARVTLALRNDGALAVSALLLDEVPAALLGEFPAREATAAPQQTARVRYDVRPRMRGDARLGSVFLRYRSPWRFAERWALAPLAQTVRVYPNLEESKRDTVYLIRSRQVAIEKRHRRLPGHGREFQTLRDYRTGDEWRDICWTASARRAKLIAKAYQVERSQTVWLVLDTGRLLRAAVGGVSKLDYAVNAALSLAQVALYSGDRVALLAYGRRVQQRLPAGRGAQHVRALLEGLAQARGEELEADHLRAAGTLLASQKRRSLVVWFTDLAETPATPEVIEGASILSRRHLVLFVVIGQPELARLLAARPESESRMFAYAAAQEIAHRRELLLRSLRQQGVLTLQVDPHRLSLAVVNQYLEAKERSLI